MILLQASSFFRLVSNETLCLVVLKIRIIILNISVTFLLTFFYLEMEQSSDWYPETSSDDYESSTATLIVANPSI